MYFDGIALTKDFTEAAKWNGRAAAQGRPEAAYRLSVACYNGGGVKYDLPECDRWKAKAEALARPLAEQGDALAESALGDLARDKNNSKEAAIWYQKAIEHGLSVAYSKQALLSCDEKLLKEIGEKLDTQKCDLEVRKAAEMGNSNAQASSGRYYLYHVSPPDQSKAKYWWSRAAALGSAYAHRETQAHLWDRHWTRHFNHALLVRGETKIAS